MSDLKQAIQREYLKCAQDPVHFMRKYCTIQHPTKGKVKFDLYPFQEKCLTEFKDNRYNIILKARQLGISTLSAFFIAVANSPVWLEWTSSIITAKDCCLRFVISSIM